MRPHPSNLMAILLAAVLHAQEPALPQGFGGQSPEPALPSGLGQEPRPEPGEPGLPAGLGATTPQEPGLPPGLGEPPRHAAADAVAEPRWWDDFDLRGFVDVRAGARLRADPRERTGSLGELRLRLEAERQFGGFTFAGKGDVVFDGLESSWTPDLETGRGFFDLRTGYVASTPLPWLDLKLGRQVLTWGTGDLLFVNDLFPKDWVSFFVGRDDEYLKAPSDALRVGLFSDVVAVDLVYTPRFDADRFVRDERLSFFDPLQGSQVGRGEVADPLVPDDWFQDDELALRLHRNFGSVELAGYGYLGRWKSPGGFDPGTGRALFPRLAVYGASARGQLSGGIANLELGWYESRQDDGGADPFVDNSQLRVLAGYERDVPELAESLTIGAQYYLEAMLQHDDYLRTLPAGVPVRDELRHVVTLRVTKLLLEQRLRLSLFGYFSPSDHDVHLRPSASYAVDDRWTVTVGANVFAGEDDFTFFGQFDRNTNVYAAVRFRF